MDVRSELERENRLPERKREMEGLNSLKQTYDYDLVHAAAHSGQERPT